MLINAIEFSTMNTTVSILTNSSTHCCDNAVSTQSYCKIYCLFILQFIFKFINLIKATYCPIKMCLCVCVFHKQSQGREAISSTLGTRWCNVPHSPLGVDVERGDKNNEKTTEIGIESTVLGGGGSLSLVLAFTFPVQNPRHRYGKG